MKKIMRIALLAMIISCQIYSRGFDISPADIQKGKGYDTMSFNTGTWLSKVYYEPMLVDRDEYDTGKIKGKFAETWVIASFANKKAPSGVIHVIYAPKEFKDIQEIKL